jgi:hypothetical protein
MSEQINMDELKAMIANQIKTKGLNDVLDADAIEKVKDKVLSVYNLEKAKKDIPEMIPEANIPNQPDSAFGEEAREAQKIETPITPTDLTQQPGQNIDAGTTGNITAYTPELPSFMNQIEPGKVIIFSQNELSEGGENLSHKPLRTFEDPDVKKSMHDLWIDKGQRKAEVYMVKLEKIGELNFDYKNGTTQFSEKRFDPDFEAQAKYKENPYAAPSVPSIENNPNDKALASQIANSIDLQQVVTDLVMKAMRNYLLTNTERAINDIPGGLGAINPNEPSRKTNDQGIYVKESSPEEPFGYSTSQAVKPMEESFTVKMIDLVNAYEKIDTPQPLKEAFEKGDKALLSKSNTEVEEWIYEGKTYYAPVNKISTRKCYIKP